MTGGIYTQTGIDNELCETYDQWSKHVAGTIEVIFDMSGYSPETPKRPFPRFAERVAVTVICWRSNVVKNSFPTRGSQGR
jgi:hypothetical protein